MKQFLTVLKFELNSYFKNKSFMVTTVILAVVIIGLITVPPMIPGLLGEDSTQTSQEDGQGEQEEQSRLGIVVNTQEISDVDTLLSYMPADWTKYEDEAALKAAVESEEIEGGFILDDSRNVTYVVENLSMMDSFSENFKGVMEYYLKQQYLVEKGLSPEEAAAFETIGVTVTPEILGKDSVSNYAYTYVLVFLTYFLILLYGQMIATSVTTEKSNRAIEILVTSVNPNSLIFGKVLAGAIAGILQAAIFLGSAFASYRLVHDAWGGILDFLLYVPARVLAAFAVFGILSYLLYAFIFGMLGALVSKTEDISKSATPVTIIYVASFLIAIFGMTDCDGLMVKVASFIPFTSGNAMFIRIAMGSVETWEIILSAALLAVSCLVTGWLAAKLFRFGTLHYGNPVKFTKALQGVRGQK